MVLIILVALSCNSPDKGDNKDKLQNIEIEGGNKLFGFEKMDKVIKQAFSVYFDLLKDDMSENDACINVLKTFVPEQLKGLNDKDIESLIEKTMKRGALWSLTLSSSGKKIKATVLLVLLFKNLIHSSLDDVKTLEKIDNTYKKMKFK